MTKVVTRHLFSPADIYLFKVNNGSTGAVFEICSKLKVNANDVVLVGLLSTLNRLHTLLWGFHC